MDYSNRINRRTGIFLIASAVYFSPIVGDFCEQVFKQDYPRIAEMFSPMSDEQEELRETAEMLRTARLWRYTKISKKNGI